MTFINDRHMEMILPIVAKKAWQHSLCAEDNLALFAAAELIPGANARLIFYMLGDEPRFFGYSAIDLITDAIPALSK